jgi:hypothetical protein
LTKTGKSTNLAAPTINKEKKDGRRYDDNAKCRMQSIQRQQQQPTSSEP